MLLSLLLNLLLWALNIKLFLTEVHMIGIKQFVLWFFLIEEWLIYSV